MDSGSISGTLNQLSQGLDPMRPLKRVLTVCIGIVCPLFFLTLMAQLISWIFNLTVRRLNPIVVVTIWVGACILLIGLVVTGPGKSLPSKEESLNYFAWKGDAFQRVRAARMLAGAAEKGNLREVFLKLAEHPDFRVCQWAAQGLSYYTGHEVTNVLFRLSRDVHLTVVTSSIGALTRQPEVKVRDILVSLCTNHPQSYVRDTAFRALKRRGWLEKIPKKGVGSDVCF
jgi:hypothetical protein